MAQTGQQAGARPGLMTVLALALPPLFWAGNFIVARGARGDLPPVTLSYGRWIIALLCLLPFAWTHLRRDAPWYLAHWKYVLAVTIPGVTLFNTLVYLGLRYTDATNGMLLNSTIPVLILALGAMVWRKPLGVGQVVGLAVSLIGVGVVILHGDIDRLMGLQVSVGDAIIFGAMVCWAVYTLLLARIPAAINRTGLLVVQAGITLVLLLPALIWERHAGFAPVWSIEAIWAMAYIGIVPSILATLLYMKAVSLAGPALAGQSIHLLPLYGAVLSTIFLGERLQPYHAAGFVAIILGIVIASRSARG